MDFKQQRKNFRNLLALGKHSRSIYLFALAALTLAVVLESGGTLVIRHIIDEVIIPRRGLKPLALFSLLFLAMAVIKGLLQFLEGRGRGKASEEVVKRLRENLYDHIQRLSFSYHDHSQTGELVQRSTSDVDTIRRFYAEQIPDLIRVIVLWAVNFSLLMMLHPLALISTASVPLIALLSVIFFRLIYQAYDAYQEQEGILTTRVQENLAGIRVVRAFARQEWEKERFAEINREQC